MSSASAEWQKNRMKELKSTHQRCDKCNPCPLNREQLEFSHLRPTGLSGKGRGRSRRISDIVSNPTSYILSCHRRNLDIEKEQKAASQWKMIETAVPRTPLHRCSGLRGRRCRGTVFEMRGHYSAGAHHGRCNTCNKFYNMNDLRILPLKTVR
jgi:hypothetical protein